MTKRDARLVQHAKINHVIYHINKLKKKNHVIITIDGEKAFDKTQHQFIMKNSVKLGIKGNFLNLIRAISTKHLHLTLYQMVKD